jgi:hypothetical protein
MILALALSVVLTQPAPPPGLQLPRGPGPTAAETGKLYFLAGELATAQQWVQRGLKREPKTCGRLNKLLAEYAFLANHIDEFTSEQARAFFELDRQISPTVRGKLTEKAYERYVRKPLDLARSRAKGDVAGALELVQHVLAVDPKNRDALALQAELVGNRSDAGP